MTVMHAKAIHSGHKIFINVESFLRVLWQNKKDQRAIVQHHLSNLFGGHLSRIEGES